MIVDFRPFGESFVGEWDVGKWPCLNLSDFHGIHAKLVANTENAVVRGASTTHEFAPRAAQSLLNPQHRGHEHVDPSRFDFPTSEGKDHTGARLAPGRAGRSLAG